MKLKVKDVNLSTGGSLIAILNESDARKLDLSGGERVRIRRLRKNEEVIAVINISSKGVDVGEIGLFEEVLKYLDVVEGNSVDVDLAKFPISLDHIKEKLDGNHI